MDETLVKLIEMIPSILWFVFVVILVAIFYRPIRNEIIPKLSSLKAGSVELSFANIKDSMNESIKLAEKNPQWKVEISNDDKERALNRARQHLEVFRNTQMLWIDDHPENNLNERKMLRQLKIETDTAKSTNEALEILKSAHYDFIVSDMGRGGEETAGLEFLKKFREFDKTTPVIFYVGVFNPEKGIPPQAFGITNRTDELIHLVLDALERKIY